MAGMTFAEIMAQRQQEAHEREARAKQWSGEVTEELAKQQSKFMLEFTNAEKRIFGVIE